MRGPIADDPPGMRDGPGAHAASQRQTHDTSYAERRNASKTTLLLRPYMDEFFLSAQRENVRFWQSRNVRIKSKGGSGHWPRS